MSAAEVILYQTEDGQARVECRFEGETLWLTQAQMAALFQTTPQNITLHLRAIYAEGELEEAATCKDYLQVRVEGRRQVSRALRHYNLAAILAVGFRVRSVRGTQFRQWATERLGEYLLKGFTMDDERLKNPPGPGVPDYFDEQLARIQDIRASERRMYTRLRDIFALAADYTPSDEQARTVFQIVQNKMLFVACGLTAPELIAARADAEQPNMGLTPPTGSVGPKIATVRGPRPRRSDADVSETHPGGTTQAPGCGTSETGPTDLVGGVSTWTRGAVRKRDVTVAKNYLREPEIDELNRIVVMFLDYAEDQARRRKQVFLREWATKLDDFLRFNDRPVLSGPGRVSREAAEQRAAQEYEAFSTRRREERETAGEEALLRELEDAARRHEATKR